METDLLCAVVSIVAGRAKERIAFEGSEHGADLTASKLALRENLAICHANMFFPVTD
jgi:hypothetical protein